MGLLDAGDVEVDRLRKVFSWTGDAVARASAATQAARTSGSRDPYKERDVSKDIDAHSKAIHVYDIAPHSGACSAAT